jgi:uncharacterized protein YegP (UPF0339 family)
METFFQVLTVFFSGCGIGVILRDLIPFIDIQIPKNMITFKIHKSVDGTKFYVTQHGANSKVLNTSEDLNSKASAYKNINAVAKHLKAKSFIIVDTTL